MKFRGGGCNPKKPKITSNFKFGTGFFGFFITANFEWFNGFLLSGSLLVIIAFIRHLQGFIGI